MWLICFVVINDKLIYYQDKYMPVYFKVLVQWFFKCGFWTPWNPRVDTWEQYCFHNNSKALYCMLYYWHLHWWCKWNSGVKIQGPKKTKIKKNWRSSSMNQMGLILLAVIVFFTTRHLKWKSTKSSVSINNFLDETKTILLNNHF